MGHSNKNQGPPERINMESTASEKDSCSALSADNYSARTRHSNWRKRLTILTVMILILIGAGEYLVFDSTPEPADLITVLSGNDTTRLEKTAQLYFDGYAHLILLTNTGRTYGPYDTPYNQSQIEQLQAMNVPDGAIFLSDFVANNTGQEATAIIIRMVDLNLKSVIIVTDAWHLRRTRIIYTDTFSNTDFKVQYVGADEPGFSAAFWWLSPKGWKTVTGEYARIIGYFIKRGTNIPDYPLFNFFRDQFQSADNE